MTVSGGVGSYTHPLSMAVKHWQTLDFQWKIDCSHSLAVDDLQTRDWPCSWEDKIWNHLWDNFDDKCHTINIQTKLVHPLLRPIAVLRFRITQISTSGFNHIHANLEKKVIQVGKCSKALLKDCHWVYIILSRTSSSADTEFALRVHIHVYDSSLIALKYWIYYPLFSIRLPCSY